MPHLARSAAVMLAAMSAVRHSAPQLMVLMCATRCGAYPIRFVLLSQQHSGTHFFREVMTYLGVIMGNEMFSRDMCALQGKPRPPPEEELDSMFGFRDADWAAFRYCVCLRGATAGVCPFDEAEAQRNGNSSLWVTRSHQAVGFIWQCCGVSTPWGRSLRNHIQYLQRASIRVVVLERINPIAMAMSSSNTENIVHSGRGDSFNLSEADLHHMALVRQKNEDMFAGALQLLLKAHVPVLYVTYETLNRNYSAFVPILRFLGLKATFDAQAIRLHVTGPVDDKEAPASLVRSYGLSNATKHHIRKTISYIENVASIERWVTGGNIPGLQLCHLHNNCSLLPVQCFDPGHARAAGRARLLSVC